MSKPVRNTFLGKKDLLKLSVMYRLKVNIITHKTRVSPTQGLGFRFSFVGFTVLGWVLSFRD